MVAKRIIAVFKPPHRHEPPEAGADPDMQRAAARIAVSNAEHDATLDMMRRWAGRSPHDVTLTSDLDPAALGSADVVVTVGGDGTFLTAARFVTDAVMLGVNSSPATSTGHYCGATAADFRELLAAGVAGRVPVSKLTRIQASIDGVDVPVRALNEVLVANQSPAGSSRYVLRIGERAELHLSSGLWVSTASGSTAAIRSAGGDLMAPDDGRLQYLVREPYRGRGRSPTLLHETTSEPIEVLSRSSRMALYFDGDPEPTPLELGQRAILSVAPRPLSVWGYRARS